MERLPIASGAGAPLPAAPGAEDEPRWVLFEAALGGAAGQQRGGAIAEILIRVRRDGFFPARAQLQRPNPLLFEDSFDS